MELGCCSFSVTPYLVSGNAINVFLLQYNTLKTILQYMGKLVLPSSSSGFALIALQHSQQQTAFHALFLFYLPPISFLPFFDSSRESNVMHTSVKLLEPRYGTHSNAGTHSSKSSSKRNKW